MSEAPPAPPCILVVEDHEAVRALAVRTLQNRGYQVLEAADGLQALSVAATAPHIDLLVTDVEMPQLDGPELARQLAAQRAGLRVLFMTGNVKPDLPPHVRFLLKPFTPADLADAVRRTLASPAWGA